MKVEDTHMTLSQDLPNCWEEDGRQSPQDHDESLQGDVDQRRDQ